MSSTPAIQHWKRRLTAMADDPPYVFTDTPDSLIAQHYQRLTTFAGYSEEEVAAAEAELGIVFPPGYRSFLLEMAKAPGELFCGSDFAGLAGLGEFKADALELMCETDPTLALPEDAVVFLFHQGYSFTFFRATGDRDPALIEWTEGDPRPRQIAPTFEDFVEDRLGAMENAHRGLMAQGGYYLTLYPDGGGKHDYPALNSGDRPLHRHKGGSSVDRRRDPGNSTRSQPAGFWRRLVRRKS